MRVHLGKAVCESVCLCVCMCVVCREGWIIFISPLLIRPHHHHHRRRRSPHTTFSQTVFKLSLYLKTHLLSLRVCVPLALSSAFTQTHTDTHAPIHACSPWPNFWGSLFGWKKKNEDKSPWNPQNATERKTEQSVALSPPPSNSPSYQSLPPSTCVPPALYLQLPASLRPCRMTWHECRRHR